MLALRHPTLFGTFADYSGVAGPRVGSTNAIGDTVSVLFHGSTRDFDDDEPAYLLTHHRYHGSVAGWFAVGALDGALVGAARYLAGLGPRAGVPTLLVIAPDQNHTFYFWSAAFSGSLPWLVAHLRPPGSTSPAWRATTPMSEWDNHLDHCPLGVLLPTMGVGGHARPPTRAREGACRERTSQ
ncbi:MAG TPA: hypothetical protein VFX16_26385 [Pseudonocardiaceae bacterium]|nr:hypothetical protein [Pseudonocardiaceae bacterium]